MNLGELKALTNEAIEEARQANIDDAVNWADLKCISARVFLDAEGYMDCQVIIDEASPSAYTFQKWIADYLAKRGFDGVEVITEW